MITAGNEHPILPSTVIALETHLLLEGKIAIKMEDMMLVGEKENEFLSRTPRQLFQAGL